MKHREGGPHSREFSPREKDERELESFGFVLGKATSTLKPIIEERLKRATGVYFNTKNTDERWIVDRRAQTNKPKNGYTKSEVASLFTDALKYARDKEIDTYLDAFIQKRAAQIRRVFTKEDMEADIMRAEKHLLNRNWFWGLPDAKGFMRVLGKEIIDEKLAIYFRIDDAEYHIVTPGKTTMIRQVEGKVPVITALEALGEAIVSDEAVRHDTLGQAPNVAFETAKRYQKQEK